ncbi:MAG: MnhB domain-containing protein [Verrucomicrobiota bacterium]
MLIIATRYTAPLLLIISLILLYRGHNYPGGGFIGGLIAASAILLYALAHDWKTACSKMPLEPLMLMLLGLALALGSGILSLFSGDVFMTGLWLPFFELPLLGKIKLGTPLLFDVGVYLTVVGFTVKCAEALGTADTV